MNFLNNQDKLGESSVVVNKREWTLVILASYCRGGYVEPGADLERESAMPNFQYADWGYAEATWSLWGSSDDATSRAV